MCVEKVRLEHLLTQVSLEYFGVIAALEHPERFDQAVEEQSMRGSPAWDTLDRWEERAREIVRELLPERAF